MLTLFALSLVKTIMSLSHKVPFGSEINIHIIEHLKEVVKNFNSLDPYYTCMFGKMALEASLHYDKYKDCVFGL